MAVLVEGISVIVRRDSIERSLRGGWSDFVQVVRNATLCSDDEVARVGFMDPGDVQSFVGKLGSLGLRFVLDGKAQDVAVVDQQQGLTTGCDWLEFGRLPWGEGDHIAACWLFEGPRVGAGAHFSSSRIKIATPSGWEFEGSLSQQFSFIPTGQSSNLQFVRHEDGVDVYRDPGTGKEQYIAREGKTRKVLFLNPKKPRRR